MKSTFRKPRHAARRGAPDTPDRLTLYGIHTVAMAIGNPKRTATRLRATENALARLSEEVDVTGIPVEVVSAQTLTRSLPADAVHQGAALDVEPLVPRALDDLESARLLVALDQVTDPHNVGAIMRTAVAFGADAFMTLWRHSPKESAVLAKSASGAVDCLDHIQVRNLSKALVTLQEQGFQAIGLDSAGATPLGDLTIGERVVLVLGAEGKGLRQGVRETCDVVARLDLPGRITSLNVSNAAAIALYAVSRAR